MGLFRIKPNVYEIIQKKQLDDVVIHGTKHHGNGTDNNQRESTGPGQ